MQKLEELHIVTMNANGVVRLETVQQFLDKVTHRLSSPTFWCIPKIIRNTHLLQLVDKYATALLSPKQSAAIP